MAVSKRRLELNCIICLQPLTSMQPSLPQDILHLVTEHKDTSAVASIRKRKGQENNSYMDIDHDQVVATKCGHMFHIGCLRGHVKKHLERVGVAPCPMCNKPVTLTRLWPVLIPPTPQQYSKLKKMHFMKKQNADLKLELTEIRKRTKRCEAELQQIEEETQKYIADIELKEEQIKDLNGPSEEELEELRQIHKKRQAIVRAVTKHNADLLGVLMHETNLQMTESDYALSEQEITEINNNLQKQEAELERIYGKSYGNQKSRRVRNRNRSQSLHRQREHDTEARHRDSIRNLSLSSDRHRKIGSNSLPLITLEEDQASPRLSEEHSDSDNSSDDGRTCSPSEEIHGRSTTTFPEAIPTPIIRSPHQDGSHHHLQSWRPGSPKMYQYFSNTIKENRSLALPRRVKKVTGLVRGRGNGLELLPRATRIEPSRLPGPLGRPPGISLALARKERNTRDLLHQAELLGNLGERHSFDDLRLPQIPDFSRGSHNGKKSHNISCRGVPPPSKNSKPKMFRPKWC